VVVHETDGSDTEKVAYLQSLATADMPAAPRYPVPSRYSVRDNDGSYTPGIHNRLFQQLMYAGRSLELFDEILQQLGAGTKPLVCVTPVVDGAVKIDKVGTLPEIPFPDRIQDIERFAAPNYLDVYLTEQGFDIPRLLNDDYFRAVKLLFNERLFVSAAKLMMSFVDTVAYLHEGDLPGNFQRWLESYVDMPALRVSPEELWEFRNSLLHMTNVHSRKVVAGRVSRILFFVGTMPLGLVPQDADAKYFNLHQLIHALADGLEKWIGEFNGQPARMREFHSRYETVLSDVRYEVLSRSEKQRAQGSL